MKKNTKILLGISGVVVAAAAFYYMRKKDGQVNTAVVPGQVQAGDATPSQQVVNSTVTTGILNPTNANTGIVPPPMQRLPVIAQSAGLRPASIVDNINTKLSLTGPWLTF